MPYKPGLPAIPARHPAGGWQAGLGQGHNQKKDTHTLAEEGRGLWLPLRFLPEHVLNRACILSVIPFSGLKGEGLLWLPLSG